MATKTRKPAATQQELDLHAPLAAELTPAELHGVARVALQAKKVRDELPAGVHTIDLAVRLVGSLVVGPDQPGGTTTETPKAEHVLAVLFAAASPRSRTKMLALLESHYEDWIAGKVASVPNLDAKQSAIAADVFGSLSRQAQQAGKHGSVTGAIECRLIRRYE